MDGEILKVKRRRRRFHSEGVTVFDAVIYAGRKTKQDMVKMNSMRVFASVAMAMGVFAVMAAEKTVVSSPDGKNEIRLYANPLTYEVVREGVTVVAKSEIGLTVDGARLGGEDATGCVPPVVKRETRSGVADAPVYKKSKVDLSANEAFVDFAGGLFGLWLVPSGIPIR